MKIGRNISLILIVSLWLILTISIIQIICNIHRVNNIEPQTIRNDLSYELNNSHIENDTMVQVSENKTHYRMKVPRCCGYEEYNLLKNDSDKIINIYLFGGSSVVHHPCKKEKFSLYLEEYLDRKYKNKSVRIINLGYSGFTSDTILKRMKRLINIKSPDLVFLYSGHNNYIMAHRKTLRKKVDLFCKDNILSPIINIYSKSFEKFNYYKRYCRYRFTPALIRKTHEIGLISDKLARLIEITNNQALKKYKKDVNEMKDILRGDNIPFVVSTLIFNLEHPPKDINANFDSKDQKALFNKYKDQGKEYYEKGHLNRSVRKLEQAYNIYQRDAELNFDLGNLYRLLVKYEKAEDFYKKAKDLDNWNYDIRAKTELNDFIRDINDSGVYSLDLEKKLEEKRGIILNDDFFVDMIHIDKLEKNKIIANELANIMIKKGIVNETIDHDLNVQ